MNYTSFVNKYRIDEAMAMLMDQRYEDLSMEEIADLVGFSNRQSFYASFYRITGTTPRDFKKTHYEQHPELMEKSKKKNYGEEKLKKNKLKKHAHGDS